MSITHRGGITNLVPSSVHVIKRRDFKSLKMVSPERSCVLVELGHRIICGDWFHHDSLVSALVSAQLAGPEVIVLRNHGNG